MPLKDKEAHRKYCRDRYRLIMSENPDNNKQYYQKHREKLIQKSRDNHLKNSYNLTRDQYALLVESQNNRCAICEQEESRFMKNGKIKPLSIDHDHVTGKLRQLLCNDCNAALGFAKDNPKLLRKMAKYLENHQ